MQPFFVKTLNLSWEFWVNLGLFSLKRRVAPDSGPVGIFAQAIRVAFAVGLGAFPNRLVATADTIQTAFPVGLDWGEGFKPVDHALFP